MLIGYADVGDTHTSTRTSTHTSFDETVSTLSENIKRLVVAFTSAYKRPNIVVVEVEIPESELTSGYKADKAKDSVGAKQWKAGIIQGILSGTREVILTRWAKPVRIVPVEEVADHIAGLIEGKVEVMPTNVVTPQQREALEERGVKFVETDNKGKIRDDNKNTVIFHEVRKKSGRRMCRQLPLTSFSQCFLTKGKRLTGGCLIFTPARLQTVHRRNASPHCKHRNSHYFRMRTLRTRVFPAASAFTT